MGGVGNTASLTGTLPGKAENLMIRLRGRHPRSGAAPAMYWSTLTWTLLVLAALLPIGALGAFAYLVTARSVRDLVAANNQSAATITAELVRHDIESSL